MVDAMAAGRAAAALDRVRELLYGMTGHEFEREALAMRAQLETLFMLVTLGELVGVPVLPPYYGLRVLPYVVPNIATWKRRVLRERHFTEDHDYDLHGV